MNAQFLFDTNKCTACRACEIACKIENKLDLSANWRSVITYNKDQIPDKQYYHLSLACNHCEDAPCMKYCPALAISRKSKTGAVIIDETKCIGCSYCSWVCPYSAPDFNKQKGIMEKCTFCDHRLEEGMTTACASVCPTGALSIEHNSELIKNDITGFPETGIQPKIRIIKPRYNNVLPEYSQPYDENLLNLLTEEKSEPKIDIKKEWVLAAFTFVFMFLTGLFTTAQIVNLDINSVPFLISGLMAMGISVIHLGKIERAYRAILNLKNSWLSREIIFTNLFVFAGFFYLLLDIKSDVGIIISALGFAALFSIDSVYRVIPKADNSVYKNNHTFVSSVFFIGILISTNLSFYILIIIKTLLWLNNNRLKEDKNNLLLFYSKLLLGFVLPAVFTIIDYTQFFYFSVISILISEFLERIEFYIQLEPITPRADMKQ